MALTAPPAKQPEGCLCGSCDAVTAKNLRRDSKNCFGSARHRWAPEGSVMASAPRSWVTSLAGGTSLPLSSEELGDSAGTNPDGGLPYAAGPRGARWRYRDRSLGAGLARRRGVPKNSLGPAAESESRTEQPREAKARCLSARCSGRVLAGVGVGLRGAVARQDTFSSASFAPSKNSLGLRSGTFGGLALETRASHPGWHSTVGPEGRLVNTAKVPHVRGRPYGRVVY
jgi:hypothetical protein